MKKINTVISIFIMAAIVIVAVIPLDVSAAEVESLPAFSNDIVLEFDSEGFLFKTSEYEQYLSFDQSLLNEDGLVVLYYSESGECYTTNNSSYYPFKVNDGNFSYWYSAKSARIYVISSLSGYYPVLSELDGYFLFDAMSSSRGVSLGYYDLLTGSFVPVLTRSKSVSDSDFIFNGYRDVDGSYVVLPNDLLCLYSNYRISGFYEPEVSDVYTPDYYFKYQYLFHVDGVGYTFVDSAYPLIGISNDDPTKAILRFMDVCNKHVYTSINGTSWSQLTTIGNIYSDTILLDYSYFYDSPAGAEVYTLVYTSDVDYIDDDPLLTLEYGSIEDIIFELRNDELFWRYYFDNIPDIDDDINDHDGLEIFFAGLFQPVDNYLGTAFLDIFGLDEVYNWTVSDYANLYVLAHFTQDYVPVYDSNGNYLYSQPSLVSYLYGIFNNTYDISYVLKDMRLLLHTDLQSVFDNISITNTYLYDVKKLIKDMPDYTKDIRELKAAIEAIDIQSPDIVMPDIDIPDYAQELEDIRVLLEGLDINISVPSDGNVVVDVPEFDDSDILHSLSGINNSVNYIAGLIAVDNVTDFFVDLFEEEQEEDAEDVGEFITNAITIINANKLLTAAFDYMGTLSNGITWVNLNVQHIYDVSGALRGVLLLGVTLFCVNLIVRRDG